MKFSKKEKDFWRYHYGINSPSAVPAEMNGVVSIDTELDDDFILHLTARVQVIRSFDLENTNITDDGVEMISRVQGVKKLSLIGNGQITKHCLEFIGRMKDLESLTLIQDGICLDDVLSLDQLPSLTELRIAAETDQVDALMEQLILLESKLPGCKLFLNHEEMPANERI